MALDDHTGKNPTGKTHCDIADVTVSYGTEAISFGGKCTGYIVLYINSKQ